MWLDISSGGDQWLSFPGNNRFRMYALEPERGWEERQGRANREPGGYRVVWTRERTNEETGYLTAGICCFATTESLLYGHCIKDTLSTSTAATLRGKHQP